MDTVLQSIADSISLGSLYSLFALGIALIFGIMRLVNFAHGELIMLSALTVVVLDDAPLVVMLAGALAVPAVVAIAMDRAVFSRARGAKPTTLLVISFGLSIFIQNLTLTLRGNTLPEGASVAPWLNEREEIGPVIVSRLSILTVVLVVVLMVALGAFLQYTAIGVQMRAAAEDFEMSRLLGVRANVVISVAFLISGVLAGVAGLLIMAQTGTWSADMGLTPVIFGFVAAVLGGLGSLSGAVIAGYLLGALSTVLQQTLPDGVIAYRNSFLFLIVLAVLLLRPGGIVQLKTMMERV